MDLEKVFVVDIECDGLLDELTKLYVMSVGWKDSSGQWRIKSTNKEEDIKKIFENPNNTVVGHFFIGYDIRALKKLFPNINFKANIVCSLSLSHYLYNDRLKHGLEDWGIEFGFEKVKVEKDEWLNLTYEKAVERCERDVLINCLLWDKQYNLLLDLYGREELCLSPIARCNFKMDLLVIQEENRIKLDIDLAKDNLLYLEQIIEEKTKILNGILPRIPVKVTRSCPKSLYKKDGSLSTAGLKWKTLTEGCGLTIDYQGIIQEVVRYEEPNCLSTAQMKNYLLRLGWKPILFKGGANGKVPQLRDDDKNLCKSLS